MTYSFWLFDKIIKLKTAGRHFGRLRDSKKSIEKRQDRIHEIHRELMKSMVPRSHIKPNVIHLVFVGSLNLCNFDMVCLKNSTNHASQH